MAVLFTSENSEVDSSELRLAEPIDDEVDWRSASVRRLPIIDLMLSLKLLWVDDNIIVDLWLEDEDGVAVWTGDSIVAELVNFSGNMACIRLAATFLLDRKKPPPLVSLL